MDPAMVLIFQSQRSPSVERVEQLQEKVSLVRAFACYKYGPLQPRRIPQSHTPARRDNFIRAKHVGGKCGVWSN